MKPMRLSAEKVCHAVLHIICTRRGSEIIGSSLSSQTRKHRDQELKKPHLHADAAGHAASERNGAEILRAHHGTKHHEPGPKTQQCCRWHKIRECRKSRVKRLPKA